MENRKHRFIFLIVSVFFFTFFFALLIQNQTSYHVVEGEYIKSVTSYDEALSYESLYNISLVEYSPYGYALYEDSNHQESMLIDLGFQYNSISSVDASPWRTTITSTEDKYLSSQYGLAITNTLDAWDVTVGSSAITIAIIDTGIDIYHEEFVGRISSLSKNIVTGVVGLSAVKDDYGHGTMVAGIIGATKDNTVGIAGITQNTVLLVIKANQPGEGSFTDSSIIAGIYYAIEQGADIINLSLGSSYPNADMNAAIEAATSAGIIVVGASGNDGTSDLMYPASFDDVISVSAVDSTKTIASYSNTNNAVDLSAPGSDIITTSMDGTYMSGSGTSFAAPHVTGILALYKSIYPNANVNEIKSKVYQTAMDLGTSGYDNAYGNGLINADQLLTAHFYTITYDSSPGTAVEPSYILEGNTGYSLPSPTLTNEVFMGWYTNPERTIPFDPTDPLTENITLYALYSDLYHTVHFVTSGSQVSDLIVDHFDYFTLPSTLKEGYSFDGWYIDDSYTSKYTPSPVVQDITLYAKFTQINYFDISYYLFDQLYRTDQYQENTSIILPVIDYQGYTFSGWYMEDSFITSYSSGIATSDLSLYAKMEINSYLVTLHYGSHVETLEFVYNTYPTLPEVVMDGMEFAGWYTDSNYTTRYTLKAISENIELYAKFVGAVFEVSLYVNNTYYDSAFFEADETIALPTLLEDGKTFDGWYSDTSLSSLFTDSTISENIQLYGTLTDTIYTIHFYDANGALLSTHNLSSSEVISYPTAPLKSSTPSFTYTFIGWSENVIYATSDLDIYPIYTSSFIPSSATFNPSVSTISVGDTYTDTGITLLDSSLFVEVTNHVNSLVAGKYSVIYSIYQGDELCYELTRYVEVLESNLMVVITLNPGITTLYLGESYIEAGATSTYGEVSITGEVDTFTAGSYVITYQVEVDDIIYIKTRIVTILDSNVKTTTVLAILSKKEEWL